MLSHLGIDKNILKVYDRCKFTDVSFTGGKKKAANSISFLANFIQLQILEDVLFLKNDTFPSKNINAGKPCFL